MPTEIQLQQNESNDVNVTISIEVRQEDLKTYEEMLREALSINSKKIFPNADKHHAAVAMSVLFEHTSQSVSLLVDSFNGDVSNNPLYLSGLTKCLDRGASFKILTLKTPNETSKGYQLLLERKRQERNKIDIRQARDESLKILEESSLMKENLNFGETCNFGLFDSNKYRFELIPSKYMAILAFNDEAFVTKCRKIFDSAFVKADKV